MPKGCERDWDGKLENAGLTKVNANGALINLVRHFGKGKKEW